MNSYAHSLPGDPNVDRWELMSDHEQRVAELCESFLARIDSDLGPWGNLLGRWHDLGKYSEAFQAYLRHVSSNDDDIHRSDLSGKVDHSTAAAHFAVERENRYGKLLAYIFAGHHAGLPDWDVGSGHSGLKQRLEKRVHPWQCESAKEVAACSVPQLPKFASVRSCETIDRNMIAAFRVSFWVRLLFSSLVDADFLATESFMSPLQTISRPKSSLILTNLAHHLENHLSELQKTVEQSAVNDVRKEVSDACREAAKLPPGLLSLRWV